MGRRSVELNDFPGTRQLPANSLHKAPKSTRFLKIRATKELIKETGYAIMLYERGEALPLPKKPEF